MEPNGYETVVNDWKNGKLTVGVDRGVARAFFMTMSYREFLNETGRDIRPEKLFFNFIYLSSWGSLLVSVILSFIAVKFFGLLAAPILIILFFLNNAISSTGASRLFWPSIFLIGAAVAVYIIEDISVWTGAAVLLFGYSLWAMRASYIAAAWFYRAVCFTDQKTFCALRESVVIKVE